MEITGTVQKTIRIKSHLFMRIAKYAESLQETTQNDLMNKILEAGLEYLEEDETEQQKKVDKPTDGYNLSFDDEMEGEFKV